MRTKILKIGMPLMVFMLAIVFAFATPTKEEKNSVQIAGYIQQPNDCVQVLHNCSISPGPVCQIAGNTVFRTKAGTLCLNQMFWQP